MQRLLVSVLCTIGAATASAAPAAKLPFDTIHAACSGFARAAVTGTPRAAAEAKISLASCEARERTRAIAIVDQERSVRELAAAIAPCLELLQDVHSRSGLVTQVAALYADANIRTGFAVRALSTVSTLPASTSEDLAARHDLDVLTLRERVQHWFDRAHADFVEIDRMVRRHPELAREPAIAAAVAHAARQVVPVVAGR